MVSATSVADKILLLPGTQCWHPAQQRAQKLQPLLHDCTASFPYKSLNNVISNAWLHSLLPIQESHKATSVARLHSLLPIQESHNVTSTASLSQVTPDQNTCSSIKPCEETSKVHQWSHWLQEPCGHHARNPGQSQPYYFGKVKVKVKVAHHECYLNTPKNEECQITLQDAFPEPVQPVDILVSPVKDIKAHILGVTWSTSASITVRLLARRPSSRPKDGQFSELGDFRRPVLGGHLWTSVLNVTKQCL